MEVWRRSGGGVKEVHGKPWPNAGQADPNRRCCVPSLPLQVVYFGDSMRSDMFPASSFAKWETVMIAEEMEGEGVAKSDAALNNEAQVEPLEKKGKFEVSPAAVFPTLPLRYLSTSCLFSLPHCCRLFFLMRLARLARCYSNMHSESILVFDRNE